MKPFITPGLDYRPEPGNPHPRARGTGDVLLAENWDVLRVPLLVENAMLAGWDVDYRRGDWWYRLASPEYVAWIVRQNRRTLADLPPAVRETVKHDLRRRFEFACGLEPILSVWARNRVNVPDNYLGPGESSPMHRVRRCVNADYQIGPPYPGRVYTIQDVNEQDRKFLLDKKASK